MPIEIDQAFLERGWIFPIVITLVLGVVGMIGNLSVIIVYTRYIPRVEERFFIPYLAVADGCSVMIASLFFLLLDIKRPFFTSDPLCRSLQFFVWSSNQCSTLIILSLAIHRYLKICRPLGPQMSLKWKRISVIGCSVIAVVTSLPICFFTGIYEVLLITTQNTTYNGSFCVVNGDDGKEGGTHYTNFLFFGNFTLLITIVILYALVGKTIFHRHRKNKLNNTPLTKPGKSSAEDNRPKPNGETLQDPSRSKIRTKFTTTFSLIVLSYVMSYLPVFIILGSKRNNPMEFYSMPEWKAELFLLIHRSYILNNVVNPLIYTFFDSLFRKKFKQMLQSFHCRW